MTLLNRPLFLILCMVVCTLLITGCTTMPQPCIEGSGTVTSENRDVGSFEGISLAMPATLTLRNGEIPGLLIEADNNILPFISASTREGNLVMRYTRPCVNPSRPVRITVTAPVFREVAILGTGRIESDGTLRSESLAARITGSGDMDLVVETGAMATTVTGTGDVKLSGSAPSHTIALPGAGNLDATGLQTERTTVEILGSGNAKVNASQSLIVKITGAGSVLYTGNPRVEQTITGTGSVRAVD